MSNFQRTRSKVWWGDAEVNNVGSPVAIPVHSPVAQSSNWNRIDQVNEEDWSPQLPQWISVNNTSNKSKNSSDVIESPQHLQQWPLRRDSPRSHKSQDSGFSDSDTSPPVSQYYSPPDKSSSINDSNNNENVTVKFNNLNGVTLKDKSNTNVDIKDSPKHKVRSTSVIQTPYDLETYIELHCDEEHLKLFKDHTDDENASTDKCKDKLINSKATNVIKTAKVIVNDKASPNNLEYLQVSDNDEIAVNNKPRVRTPITQVNTENEVISITLHHDFKTRLSNERENNKEFNKPLDEKTTNDKIKTPKNLLEIMKTPKRSTKIKSKNKNIRNKACSFRIFSNKKDNSPVEETDDQWVMVSDPKERLIDGYKERFVHERGIEVETKDNIDDRLPPPPIEFRDPITKIKNKHLNGIRNESGSFNDELDMVSSTPKMLTPNEFMDSSLQTPRPQSNSLRRVNLLDNINSSQRNNKSTPEESSDKRTTLEKLCKGRCDSIQYWLCDIISACDNECMTTLQSKPLRVGDKVQSSTTTSSISGNIRKVQTHGQIIVQQYSDILRSIENHTRSDDQLCLLVANINEFVLTHSITLNTKPPGETPTRWESIKRTLDLYLQKLIDVGEDIKVELNETVPEWNVVLKHLQCLIDIFTETVKAVFIQQLRTLVSIIEDPPSDQALKSTLSSINHLSITLEVDDKSLHETCEPINRLIWDLPFAECGVPRALLTVIIDSKKSSVKALSLRALATICVTDKAVQEFEECGGIEILSDILAERCHPEAQISEAITVLTQITAPWLRGHYKLNYLSKYIDGIIFNITDVVGKTESCQLTLLCTACIVNVIRETETDADGDVTECDVIDIIIKHKTVETVLEAVKRKSPNISVFLQEQTALLLRTLCQTAKGLSHLSTLNVVCVALVCYCRTQLSHATFTNTVQQDARDVAYASLIEYTTETISILCSVPTVASQIIQLEGLTHIINIIRSQKLQPKLYQNNSNQILFSCLKTLRYIYKYYPESFKCYENEVESMIKPNILESLVRFSSKQESYV